MPAPAPSLTPLPVDAVLPQVIAALGTHASVVLRAPTGSGKTTRVPAALCDTLTARGLPGRVVMLEPRRVAARAAARRIAFERNSNVGEEVGYAVRFDQKQSSRTRLLIVTDGILLRFLQDDPFLESTQTVVFDEFHERSLNVDLALAMVRRVQQTVRPDLKIVVMSATLDTSVLCRFLGDCPVVTAEGRLFPVATEYLPVSAPQEIAQNAATGVRHLANKTGGDLLVFLPGVGEIRRTADLLAGDPALANALLMPLYGDLPPEQQDAVLRPAAKRKVVLATNVAETSLTIEGVTGVVDTGFVRVLQRDAGLELDRLLLTRISQASAEQRAGRAGRTAPGICLRLWNERELRGWPEFTEPEIRRVDITGAVLQLACWGEDAATFPWFEAPTPLAISQAHGLLELLGALDKAEVTPLGRAMARFPVTPRLARLLCAGVTFDVAEETALVAALLSERSPFLTTGGRRSATHHSQSDVVDRVQALREFERTGRTRGDAGELHVGGARGVLRVRDQFLSILREVDRAALSTPDERPSDAPESRVRRAILAAYPDRVARRREAGGRRALLVGGRGVRLDDGSAVAEPELFVCVDVDAGGTESLVRLASGIERDWLPPSQLDVQTDLVFDEPAQRVAAIRRTVWRGLVLDEAPAPLPGGESVAQLLATEASSRLAEVLPDKSDEWEQLVQRARCLAQWRPDLGLPALDDEQLRSLLPQLARGRRSFEELRRAPWLDFAQGLFQWTQWEKFNREAPAALRVPSGNHIRLKYEFGRPPVLAVRIQEMFGLPDTPAIAGGRVRVVLHLLAPNMRPQQITDDLRSFWDTTYQQVRKDLRRRYPKHSWPDDPWTAVAVRKR